MADQQVGFRTAPGMAASVRLTAVVAGALVLAVSVAGCGSSSTSSATSSKSASSSTNAPTKLVPASIKSKGAITYSSPFDYPPWDFQSSSGGYDGMEYEVITAVGKILGLKINTVKASSFSGLIPAVQSGRVDVGAEAMNILPDRLKVVSFAGWTNYTDGLIVKAGNPDNINTGDVCGLKIAVVTGSSEIGLYGGLSKTCKAASKPGVTISQFAQTSAVLLAVEGGRAQAGGFDIFNNAYIAQTSAGKLEAAPGDPIGTPIPVGMAVAKTADGEGLGMAISAALAQMQASGDLGKIFDKWKIPQSAINLGFKS